MQVAPGAHWGQKLYEILLNTLMLDRGINGNIRTKGK